MESWVSSNCTRNIFRPSTPEKEVNREENTVGKITNRRQIATDSKVYACSDTDFGEVLFYYVLFCDKKNRDLSSKIYRVSFGGIWSRWRKQKIASSQENFGFSMIGWTNFINCENYESFHQRKLKKIKGKAKNYHWRASPFVES